MVFILALPRPGELSPIGHKTLAVAILMAFWWITEALPLAATALIPLALFPLLGIMNYKDVAPNYGDSIIFLFMGGFFLAATMQKWNLHKRLALYIVSVIGTSARRLVLGFMIATAFISMFISNTSAALLMYPIALAVLMHLSELKTEREHNGNLKNLQIALMLGLLLLFGGGIALADAFQASGLAAWLGSHLTQLSRLPVVLMILLICLLVTFLTEVTSNTAITTILMPIMASTAVAMHTHPFLLMIPATLSASCGFMLPVATPPNAIIFGSGYLTIGDMAKAGLIINLIGAVLITMIFYGLILLQIIPATFPPWAQSA